MPGTEITGVQQRHLEAKLRGESLAGAGVQRRGISWWAFRQRAETWMLPYCWKQCMNKILHDHSSSQISLTHRHCPQGLSPEITMSTWSVQQPRQPLDAALAYTQACAFCSCSQSKEDAPERLEHRVLTCSCWVQGGCHSHQGPSLREHFWGGIQGLTDTLQANREQRSLSQQAHANKEKGEK